MSRAKWKGPFIYNWSTKIKNRNEEIVPNSVGKTFLIHQGKGYNELHITEEMVGYRFGEFLNTRATFIFKKKKKKKK
jgi:small subunit ribosomal protein S19